MSHNPYQSPQSSASYGAIDPKQSARSAVTGPAIALMVVAGISIALLCLSIPFDLFLLISGKAEEMDRGGELNPVLVTAVRTLWSFLLLGASIFVVWGANQMRQLRKYELARMAAIAAAIPCVGPCCVLGIPFGIWSVVVLSKPEVKSAFES